MKVYILNIGVLFYSISELNELDNIRFARLVRMHSPDEGQIINLQDFEKMANCGEIVLNDIYLRFIP